MKTQASIILNEIRKCRNERHNQSNPSRTLYENHLIKVRSKYCSLLVPMNIFFLLTTMKSLWSRDGYLLPMMTPNGYALMMPVKNILERNHQSHGVACLHSFRRKLHLLLV